MNRTKTHNAPHKIATAALLGVACFLMLGHSLQASSLTLTWRPPASGPEVAGYYLYMACPAVSSATDVVVDDPAAAYVGTWISSTSVGGYHGTGYRHDGQTDKGSKSAVFRPNLPSRGSYSVYIRYPSAHDRATNVPVDVVHADGSRTFTVNQQQNGSQWNLLGTFRFEAGTSGHVRMRNDGTTGYVIADAVKWVPTSLVVDVGNVTSHVVHDLVPGQLYSFHVTAYNPHGLESDPSNTFEYIPPDPGSNNGGDDYREPVIIDLMASAGQVQSPMLLESDPRTPQGTGGAAASGYVYSPVPDSGSVTFLIQVPNTGTYVIWCKTFAHSGFIDSIHVSVNGHEPDLYFPTEGGDPLTWHWSRVNGTKGEFPYAPRLFQLHKGINSIRFSTADPMVSLARILVTDDLEFVPEEARHSPRQPPRVLIERNGTGTVLRWPSEPGKNYHVFYKENLADNRWVRPAHTSWLRASGSWSKWIDPTGRQSGFYVVYAAP